MIKVWSYTRYHFFFRVKILNYIFNILTICHVFEKVKFRLHEDNIVIVKSWNEWGEGNYLEPDLQYGKDYIKATQKALDEVE